MSSALVFLSRPKVRFTIWTVLALEAVYFIVTCVIPGFIFLANAIPGAQPHHGDPVGITLVWGGWLMMIVLTLTGFGQPGSTTSKGATLALILALGTILVTPPFWASSVLILAAIIVTAILWIVALIAG